MYSFYECTGNFELFSTIDERDYVFHRMWFPHLSIWVRPKKYLPGGYIKPVILPWIQIAPQIHFVIFHRAKYWMIILHSTAINKYYLLSLLSFIFLQSACLLQQHTHLLEPSTENVIASGITAVLLIEFASLKETSTANNILLVLLPVMRKGLWK